MVGSRVRGRTVIWFSAAVLVIALFAIAMDRGSTPLKPFYALDPTRTHRTTVDYFHSFDKGVADVESLDFPLSRMNEIERLTKGLKQSGAWVEVGPSVLKHSGRREYLLYGKAGPKAVPFVTHVRFVGPIQSLIHQGVKHLD